jgi:hypothetical protein
MFERPPPLLPPKPGSRDISRNSTPIAMPSVNASTDVPGHSYSEGKVGHQGPTSTYHAQRVEPDGIADAGDQWLPRFLQDKSLVWGRYACGSKAFANLP